TRTSATWTPPTPELEMPRLSGLSESANFQLPWPLASSMPSRAQASFHDQLLSRFLSTTLPFSSDRSSLSASSFLATLPRKSSRAAVAACRAAGACDGQVVLPPEPDDDPQGLSPMR